MTADLLKELSLQSSRLLSNTMTSKSAKYSPGGVSEDTYVYGTDRQKRGTAVVFSIREFSICGLDSTPRTFTDLDVATIKTPLVDLGFTVDVVMKDPNGPQGRVSWKTIEAKINEVAKADHSRSDCFLCLFLSYGYNGQVYASDGVLPIERLQQPFKSQDCSLIGKPKIFILQTCMREPDVAKADADGVLTRIGTIPPEADFLFFWSLMPTSDFPWVKDGQKTSCSIFVKVLAEHIKEYVSKSEKAGQPKEEFVHFCVRVTRAVALHLETNYAGELEKDGKLLPCLTTMLTKELYMGKKEIPIEF